MSSNNFSDDLGTLFCKRSSENEFSGITQVFRRPSDLGEPYSATVLRISFSALASVFSTSANSILLPDTSACVSLNTT